MGSIRTAFRNAIAFLGLVAVLLGALEHESLVLQADFTAVDSVASETFLKDGQPIDEDSHLVAFPSESGTEGTFRSEIHFLATAPAGSRRMSQRIRLSSVDTGQCRAPLCRGQQARSLRIGVVALRL